MKHLSLFFFILILSYDSGLELNNFLSPNSQHETLAENSASAKELIDESITNDTDFQFMRVKFYDDTTQQQINESIVIIDPLNHLRCADDPNVYVMAVPYTPPVQGEGRSRGSRGGSGDTDNVVSGIPYVQNYSFGRMCD